MKVAVVTPSIGNKHLRACIESVQLQTYSNITHYVFLDGAEHFAAIRQVIDTSARNKEITTVALEKRIGGRGFYGHKVYASCAFIVDADLICFLDEDNFYRPEHVESLVRVISQNNLSGAYSLREIYDESGAYLLRDDCESLVRWQSFQNRSVIDTSCYAVKKSVLLMMSPIWYGVTGTDAVFCNVIGVHHPDHRCTGLYTLGYRLGGTNSLPREHFERGNQEMLERYPNGLPWKALAPET